MVDLGIIKLKGDSKVIIFMKEKEENLSDIKEGWVTIKKQTCILFQSIGKEVDKRHIKKVNSEIVMIKKEPKEIY